MHVWGGQVVMKIEVTIGPKVHAVVPLKMLAWNCRVHDRLLYVTQLVRVPSFLLCEDGQENYSHICVHAYAQIMHAHSSVE